MTENAFLHSALRSRNMVIGLGLTAVFVIGTLVSLIWTPHDVTCAGNRKQAANTLVVMLLVFAVILVNFFVDIAYAWVDPRLRVRS